MTPHYDGAMNSNPDPSREVVLVASYIEAESIERIRAVSRDLEVIYRPELLRPPRYPADHIGAERDRSRTEEAEWHGCLARATILFDFDRTHLADLPELAPNVRWIQATSAGIGQTGSPARVRYPDAEHRLHDGARRARDPAG